MRHALVLICLAVVIYAAWQFMNPVERRHAARHITRHGLRLSAIVLVILLLLFAASQFSASTLI